MQCEVACSFCYPLPSALLPKMCTPLLTGFFAKHTWRESCKVVKEKGTKACGSGRVGMGQRVGGVECLKGAEEDMAVQQMLWSCHESVSLLPTANLHSCKRDTSTGMGKVGAPGGKPYQAFLGLWQHYLLLYWVIVFVAQQKQIPSVLPG